MVIHGEGREGGVLPVIASQRGRKGGGPEVTGAFTRDKENEKERGGAGGGIDRQEERWSEDMRCVENRRKDCTDTELFRETQHRQDQRSSFDSHYPFCALTRVEDSLM